MTGPMRDDDAVAAAALCADMLSLGRGVDLWSGALALFALGALLYEPEIAAGLLFALLAAAVAKYFALRVRLDEAVFRRWASDWARADSVGPTAGMAAFDHALGRPANGRTLAARCAGARRMLYGQALATMVQTGCMVFVVWYAGF